MSRGRVLLFLTSYLWFFSVSVHAQGMSVLPRLSDGRPNLQGVWDFRTLTPLQRPQDQENSVLSVEEAAEIEARSVARTNQAFAPSEVRDELLPVGGAVGAYNQYWVDQGAGVVGDKRTSLITDPLTGRVPMLQPGQELDVPVHSGD